MTRFRDRVGQPLGTSRWIAVDQARIDAFAHVSEDRQFIHIDPEAAAKGPFGGTIAHGFLTLSLLSTLAYDVMPALGPYDSSINYGFDRLRFLTVVPSGARVRAHFTLTDATDKGAERVLLRFETRMEIEGIQTPALVADWLVLLQF